MLENKAYATIVPTLINGHVKIYLSTSESTNDAIKVTEDSKEI